MTIQEQLATFVPDKILALCIWREARGESFAAKCGVAWVVRNRINDAKHRWPKTETDVVLERWQFSSFNSSDPNSKRFPDPHDAAWLDSVHAAQFPLPDATGGANLYHSYPDTKRELWPVWAKMPSAYPETAHIGAFRFYREL